MAAGASEEVARAIRQQVQAERLRPGDRVGTEGELAARFGVSRPTLREALRLLSAAQLIRVGRGRAGGIFVARTPNEGMSHNLSESIALMLAADGVSLAELLDARLALEVPIAGRAARNADEHVVARLEQTLRDQAGHGPGTPPFNEADTEFHRILAQAAGNDLLLALTGWILEVVQPSLVARIASSVDGDAIREQHATILRAVRRNQHGAAERAMRDHLEYMTSVLRSVESA
jgi:DNA-binding FadR family transcriptional regulator